MRQKQQEKKWKINKPMIIFYILVIYIFASFLWWSYLLYKNYKGNYEGSVQALEQTYRENNLPVEWLYDHELYHDVKAEYQRQVWMIIGEGVVFFILLGLAAWRIRKSFRQEITLARQQRNFLLSITHELKSPIASAKLGMETLLKRDLPKTKREQLLSNSLNDINRLQMLVEDILLAAKFEDSSFEFFSRRFDLSELINEYGSKYADMYGSKRNFTVQIQPSIFIEGDRHAMSAVVGNLLENAIKYSEQDAGISLSLTQQHHQAIIAVGDQGVGIPDEEKENVFKKFYRIGHEETRRAKGTGLGLFIVNEVVKGHNGSIRVGDNEPQGTVFKIRIPVYNQKADI